MELDFALLADAATVDASGKLNILGVFDRIQAREFPARHGRLSLVLRFTVEAAEAGSHQVGIRLLGPAGQEVFRLDGKMELGGRLGGGGQGVKVPHVLNLDGITFPEPGLFLFRISVDGEDLRSVPLVLEEAAGAGPPGPRASSSGPPPPFSLGPGGPARA